MPDFYTISGDPDIKFSGFYQSERSFLGAIRRRFFSTAVGYWNWRSNGHFTIDVEYSY